MTLGQRISRYRKQLNISQEELGARLGVSRQAVSKWETGLSVPDMDNLLALSREFGVSVAELTETPEKPEPSEKEPAPLPEPPEAPESESAPLPEAPHRRKSHLLWVIPGSLLLLILLLLLPTVFRPSETPSPKPPPAPIVPPANEAEARKPQSDFALILDWAEDGSFLELGSQEGEYPFGTPLSLDGEETVVKGDNGETVYTIDNLNTGGIRLSYAHMDGQPDTIWKLETAYTKEISTPRGIHVGSTKAEVVGAYGMDLVYCFKEEGSDILAEHDYFYAYQPKEAFSNSICFFMKDGLVSGIRVENMLDAGNDAYAVNNSSIFPIQRNGDPDYSNRQDIYQEPVDATRQVYIAWNQLVTNQNLSAEERYAYRRDVFTNLPNMDWHELGELGGIDGDDTIFALMDWLREQGSYSDSEILCIQQGYTASGMDGAYAESYDEILWNALSYAPVTYAKMLAYPGVMDDETRCFAITGAVFYGELFPEQEQAAVEALDAVIGTHALTAEEIDWARLLRYYLANPNGGDYGDYPKTPAELEGR